MTNPTNIAIIPARGGSKRVPDKNVRDFLGKPAIAYSIAAALQSNLFERVIVSTDSLEIASIAQQHGAEAPFLREAALADDQTPVSMVTIDALERLDPDATRYQNVAQLMPNCPLRSYRDVEDSYRQFIETAADSQISITRFGWQNPWWAMERCEKYTLKPLFPSQVTERSQDLQALFCPTGAIWWGKATVLRQLGTYHIEGRAGWEIAWQRGVDIDTEEDWQMAEVLLQMSQAKVTTHAI